MNDRKPYYQFYDTIKFTEDQKKQLAEQALRRTSFKPRMHSIVVVAAILIALMAGLTACALNLFGVRDMLMDQSGRKYITIAGFQNSNEYKALKEWEEQRPKKQSVRGSDSEEPIYNQYGAHSYSAKKTLDTILEKYDLIPYDQWAAVYDRNPESLYDALGVEGFLPESCSTTDLTFTGCSVRSGGAVLSFSDSTMLSDGICVNYEFTNSAKGYMPIFMGMEINPDTAHEWWYRTSDGTSVLLCIDENNAVILADLPNSFLWISTSAHVANTEERFSLSKEELQNFADLFSYKQIMKLGQ